MFESSEEVWVIRAFFNVRNYKGLMSLIWVTTDLQVIRECLGHNRIDEA